MEKNKVFLVGKTKFKSEHDFTRKCERKGCLLETQLLDYGVVKLMHGDPFVKFVLQKN